MTLTRRKFIKTTATAGVVLPFLASAKSYADILGANDRVNIAVIGVRSRAKAHIKAIHKYPNAKVIYNCDVDELIMREHNIWCQKTIGYVPKVKMDFRKALEDKDVDAVFIATPEHWHAPMAIMALQAGKHVYVEKPCSHNPYETELLIAAQKKYGKKVQMGNQQRAAKTSQLAVKEISEGIIGEAFKGEAYYSNNRGSIGTGQVIKVPPTLNWELWQGPAPREKYRDNIHPYNWHWFHNWGTGEIHNNGTHEIDICRWALGVDMPESVTSFGGKYAYHDDWEFPDNQQVTYQFKDNKFLTWTGHSRGVLKPDRPGRGATIYGSKGSIMLSRNAYELFDLDGKLLKTELEEGQSATTDIRGEGNLDVLHVANFLDAIRMDKKQNSPIEDAGISTMLCHLGNIAQNVKRAIKLDPITGKIANDAEAMGYWKREYQEGWEPKL